MFDAYTWREVKHIVVHDGLPNTCAWSPDSIQLASAGWYMTAGAYTRPLLSSTCATFGHRSHSKRPQRPLFGAT